MMMAPTTKTGVNRDVRAKSVPFVVSETLSRCATQSNQQFSSNLIKHCDVRRLSAVTSPFCRGKGQRMTPIDELYTARVAAGDLREDAAQRAVMPELARIQKALAAPVKTGLFRKAPPPPKGLYLWGGVGRGKSMLMDLFVEALGDIPVRRVHFHAFMQECHAAMHAARKEGVEDAIAPVAEDVASKLKVLAFDEMQITDITDAMIVGRLFEKLFAAGIVVVTTSNRIPDDLYKDGLNRQLFLPFIQSQVSDFRSFHDSFIPYPSVCLRVTNLHLTGILCATRKSASFATSSSTPPISYKTVPGLTTATQPSTSAFPLPIRTSNGFAVYEWSGNIRIYTFPSRRRKWVAAIRPASICRPVTQWESSA
jgi:hypothetical protein